MVTVGDTTTSDVETLVTILRRRATSPIRINYCPDGVQLTYYNVTVVLAYDLSLMHISYNSDFRHTLRHIACVDLHRLADFIVALERDIPQWKHIWMSHDLLIREKMRMEQKVRNVMKSLRRQWTKAHAPMTEQLREDSRIHFYNLRAHQLMIEHDIPFWRNCKTEAEILEECLVYHITPPIEQWFEEWTAFVDACEAKVRERQRNRDEQERTAQKLRHLVSLKAMKAKALLVSIECAEDVSIAFNHYISVTKHQNTKVSCSGNYVVTFFIDNSEVNFNLAYGEFDAILPLLIDSLKRINDLVPDLHKALAADSEKHGPLYLSANYSQFYSYSANFPPTYAISNSPSRRRNNVSRLASHDSYDSYKVLDRINAIIDNFRHDIAAAS